MFDLAKYTADFFKLPGPTLKPRWVREYEGLATHIYGSVAKRLITERRPYEDDTIRKYREANYEPITMGPFQRFNTDLSRVFNESQVTINAGNETLQNYIDGPNFHGASLRAFWARRLARRMILDPNGYLVRWVDKIPDAPNERVAPTVHLVLSKNVVHITDEVFTWKANEKSMVLAPDPAGGTEPLLQPLGDVYYIVTKLAYFKNVQVGRIEEKKFDMREHYAHGLNRMTLDVLGGDEISEPNPTTNEDEVWLRSYVSNALPFANECARQWTDHQGVLVTSGYPITESDPIDCHYKGKWGNCKEGKIRYREPGSDKVTVSDCPKCDGTGKVPGFGPYGRLIRPKHSILEGKPTVQPRPMIEFHNPEPAILEFGSKTWRDYLRDLEKELYQVFVEEAQSGIAKDIDREPRVAKLDEIGAHLFKVLMWKTIADFGDLMKAPSDEKARNITLPPTFVVRTEESLTEELKAVNGMVASPITAQVNLEYVTKRFPGDRVFVKEMRILSEYDPLFGKSDAEVASMLSSFITDTLAVRRHQYAFAALKRLVREKTETVLDATDIFTQIDLKVEELMPAARVEAEKPVEDPAGDFGGK